MGGHGVEFLKKRSVRTPPPPKSATDWTQKKYFMAINREKINEELVNFSSQSNDKSDQTYFLNGIKNCTNGFFSFSKNKLPPEQYEVFKVIIFFIVLLKLVQQIKCLKN